MKEWFSIHKNEDEARDVEVQLASETDRVLAVA